MTAATACGDDTTCGEGTTKVGDECVPSGDSVTCATGTVLQGTECVPDGTVICETGTTFDSDTGTCAPDITGCAEGTVLVSGECLPFDDTLVGDVSELPEPNGLEAGATTAVVPLPAVGEDVVIEGCIEPRPDFDLSDNSDGDVDAYAFQTTGPALLDITVDGVGGMSGAFVIIGIDNQLLADGWQRQGLNLVGDTTERQVFLPKAATYIMLVADSRTFAFGEGVGDGTTTCYFTTVANTAIPSATAITGAQATGTLSGDAQFFSFDPAEGDVIRTTLDKVGISEVVQASVVTMVDDVYIGSAETSSPVNDAVNGVADNSNVVFVIEESENLGLSAVDFTLDLDVVAATTLPAAGTVTVSPGADNFYYFDVAAAGTVLEFSFDDQGNGTQDFDVDLIVQRNGYRGSVFESDVAGKNVAQFTEAGRYYLRVINNDAGASADLDAAVTWDAIATPAVTQGTGATGVGVTDNPFLGGANVGFVSMDVAAARWISYSVTATDFGGAATAVALPRVTGMVDAIFDGIVLDIFGDGAQRIFRDDSSFGALVMVVDLNPGSAGATPTFDIAVDNLDFDNLNVVSEASPVNMAGINLAANETKFFLFNVGEDTDYTVTADPDASTNVELGTLDAAGGDEATIDDGGDDAAEAFSSGSAAADFLAFRVSELNGAAGVFDLSITATDPSYTRTDVAMDLSNACTNGTRLDLETFTDLVSPVQNIGFTFPFYGVDKTELYVTETGWLAFTAPANGFTSQFNDAVAPMASNSFLVQDICIETSASSVTVQWRGSISGDQARFQAILRDTGVIEFGYAAENEVAAASGGVGIIDNGGTEFLPWRGDVDDRQLVRFTPAP